MRNAQAEHASGNSCDAGLEERTIALLPADGPLLADAVKLVHEQDAGRMLAGLLKHASDTSSTHAHVHFFELAASNAEEGNASFSSHGAGQQGFACRCACLAEAAAACLR